MIRVSTLFLLSFFVSQLSAQSHWESLVKADHSWSYLVGDSEAPAGWYNQGFDHSSWNTARGSFGFGDGDDTTILNIQYSLYIRQEFTIADRSVIDSLILDIDYDDAYVVYLNGSVVSRSFNVETDYPPYNYTPTIDQEASMYTGGQPSRAGLSKNLLIDGENVLAVQGINVNPTSSDFSLAPFLQVRLDAAGITFEEVPDWFRDPDAPFESNLPIVVITTENSQSIPDEPKITAHMGIVHNEAGLNELPGTFNDYDGKIGIEIRGASSQGYAKKGYGLETRLENGENNNVSLLGMPVENDWVLHGPYSDKSLIRNVLAYQFSREMGQYAPRTRLCELFINNSYSGVYVLMEKIKRDTFRLDIGKLEPHETSGRDVTGGYIFKLDKADQDEEYWVSPYPAIDGNEIRMIYHYPETEVIATEQKAYIRNFMTGFENALAGDRFYDPVLGYKPYIDMQSFIDFFLVNELAKNVDGYRISTFLHKDKDKLDRVSPVKAGPVWDFNFGFGNADYYNSSVISGWQCEYKLPGDYWSNPFWWIKLRKDPDFFNQLVSSWKGYRSSILSDIRVDQVIDSLTTLLADAQQRNFEAFPVLNQYVWANNYVGGSYENEINYLRNWIFDRMTWMDSKLDGYMYPYSTEKHLDPEGLELELFPNPVVDQFNLLLNSDRDSELEIEFINMLAQTTYRTSYELGRGSQTVYFGPEVVQRAMPGPGIYMLNLKVDGRFAGTRKIVKK
ncbi:MAG: CotH kinase family protein [Bacteroidales bacterium]|nr:CotH kinase family protein [Bacteroidales bacterium]